MPRDTASRFYEAVGPHRGVLFGQATLEIEELCEHLISLPAGLPQAVVRALAERMKRLNSVVMSALTDDSEDVGHLAEKIGVDFAEFPSTVRH